MTRLPFTPEHRAALAVLTELMEHAGLAVRLDDAGTLIGRRDGPDGAPALLMGSHQDSVREGGAYDGIMGVVLPILALMKLNADGLKLPFPVEVLAFADEEGVRFPTALMGPRALAGKLAEALWRVLSVRCKRCRSSRALHARQWLSKSPSGPFLACIASLPWPADPYHPSFSGHAPSILHDLIRGQNVGNIDAEPVN